MNGKINLVNWPGLFPDKPEVSFSLNATADRLLLHFTVREEQTVASATHNFDEVWKDSCCELFIMFEGEDKYYNLETSCNGYQLLSYRKDRFGSEAASEETMSKIICRTSLEKHAVFPATHIDEWSLDIEIPAEVFWHSNIRDFRQVKAKGNVYKCVENLPRQHFLSWAPIESERPDFHRPEFFKPLCLFDNNC